MTKSELTQHKEQTKLFYEQQRVIQARSSEQLKYPYGPWREVLLSPYIGHRPDMHRRIAWLWADQACLGSKLGADRSLFA